MNLVLDSGGLSALAGDRTRLAELRRRNLWPPVVPAPVLVESLTGDHRRDFDTNRLVRMSVVESVDEGLARQAAALRTRSGRAASISATDAIVVAQAVLIPDAVVLTSDPDDLRRLAAVAPGDVTIANVSPGGTP